MVAPEQIIPLHDRVLIERLPGAPRLDGLIVIRENPDCVDAVSATTDGDHADYRRVPILGRVVSVGRGKHDAKFRFHPTVVKPGDVVVFTDWNDWAEAPPGFHMVREGDIWGYPRA